jgi:hypothetical protein
MKSARPWRTRAVLARNFRLRLMMLGGGPGLRPFVRVRTMVRVEEDLCPPRYRDSVWGGMGHLYRAVDEVLRGHSTGSSRRRAHSTPPPKNRPRRIGACLGEGRHRFARG